MNNGSSIAPHIFAITLFLSVTWGAYLLSALVDYLRLRRIKTRRPEDTVKALRRFIVALCLWLICASFVFRTLAVLAGLGNEQVGIVIFFTLVGTNVVGSIFALVSLKYDG